jgi:hypothetical protein
MIPLGEIGAAAVARAAFRLMNVSTAPTVEHALRRLLSFAQKGDGGLPEEELRRVCYEVFAPLEEEEAFDPLDLRLKLIEGPKGESEEAQLVAVVLAARGRIRLARGAILVGELAALAGCSPRHIRHLIDHGELRRTTRAKRSPIAAPAAIAFLRGRGVPVPE